MYVLLVKHANLLQVQSKHFPAFRIDLLWRVVRKGGRYEVVISSPIGMEVVAITLIVKSEVIMGLQR